MPSSAQAALRALLPAAVRRRIRALVRRPPALGRVRFGDFERVEPIRRFGDAHGRAIDRYYIEDFLERWSADIRGRVLEIEDDRYTRRFGGARVTASDILDVDPGNPQATIVADLAAAERLPSDAFDCVILTQTLQYVFDVDAAVATLQRILRPGGVVLATLPGICTMDRDVWFWAFTHLSAQRLFAAAFDPAEITVEAHGNVLAACALLHGLAVEDLEPSRLDHRDAWFPVTVGVRARKRVAAA